LHPYTARTAVFSNTSGPEDSQYRFLKLPSAIMGFAAGIILLREWSSLSRRLLAEQKTCERLSDRDSANAVYCLILAEDRRFENHGGVDIVALSRAILHWISGRGLEGASTIEQQLVRTLTGQRERTIRRKFKEMLLASRIRTILPKHEIAKIYLRIAYFGWNMNGYTAACKRLAISTSSPISMRDAVALVSRLKYPEPKMPSALRNQLICRRSEQLLRLIPGVSSDPLASVVSHEIVGVD
jgi:membrane carboxypeptidase/penicillin-binding protein